MLEWKITLEKQKDMPLYEQLYRRIRGEIVSGRIREGERLPSKRNLAETLHVSRNTVETAYDQLTAEGYLRPKSRSGYYVCPLEDLTYTPLEIEGHPHRFESGESDHPVKFDFDPHLIDTSLFPYESFRRQARAVIGEEKRSLLTQGDRLGEPELRREIGRYLRFARGVECCPEQIVIGSGSENMLQRLMRVFGAGTVYGLESPGYAATYSNLHSLGRAVRLIEVGEEGLDMQQLQHTDVDVMYVTPSHQFPTGGVLSAANRRKLLNWAALRPNRYILEDDYDGEFRYEGLPIPSLQSMGKDRVVYLGTFSKNLTPAMRISYMVLPPALLAEYQRELGFGHCPVSRMMQQMLAGFMACGDFEKHIHKMRKLYGRKLSILLKLVAQYPEQVRIRAKNAGLYLTMEIRNKMGEPELIEAARRAGLNVYGVSRFLPSEMKFGIPLIILGFGGIPEAKLSQAVSLLFKAWNLEP